MISKEEAMRQVKAFKERQAKSMTQATASVDAPKQRIFKVAKRAEPAAPQVDIDLTEPKRRVFKVAKIETPAAPVAPAKMSVSRAEAVKQIKAFKETEAKVSTMATKVKQRKAERLLKALVVARRAKKAAAAEAAAAAAPKKRVIKTASAAAEAAAAAAPKKRVIKTASAAAEARIGSEKVADDVSPDDIFTSLWEGEPAEKNSIRFKSAAPDDDIKKLVSAATYLGFIISTSSNGSKLITPQGDYYDTKAFPRTFNRKAWLAYNDADGDNYSAAQINMFKPNAALIEKRTGIRSLGQWSWRRFGGNEVQGQDYQVIQDSSGKYYTTFKITGVKQRYSGYWPEWSSLYGKPVVWETIGLDGDSTHPESEVVVSLNGDIDVKIPGRGTKRQADKWLEQNFGATLMNKPEDASVKEEAPAAPSAAPKQFPLVKNLTDAENDSLTKYMKSTPTDAVMVISKMYKNSREYGNDVEAGNRKFIKQYYGIKEFPLLPFERTYFYHDKYRKILEATDRTGYHG